MKNIIIVMVFMLSFSAFAQGQPSKEKKEDKVKAWKIAFITERLDLSSDEAQKFWPLFNAFEAEGKAIKEKYKLDPDANKDGQVSEEEAEKALTKQVEMHQAQVDLLKKYNIEFKKAIPASKIVKLYQANEDFKKVLLQRLKKMQQNKPQRPGGGGTPDLEGGE
ncbi:MAG: sensor of ECF-type sigma factor [Bacteroidota bacterium]|nr:sensor of ECF-type sigma factor [Bacteroidota bacterium]